MSEMLRAELIKLRTTRTFAALAGVAVATSLLLAGLTAGLGDIASEESALTDVFTSDTSSIFILILAIIGVAGEWRHRTITSSLLASPQRARWLGAKTLAFAAAGLVLSLLISIAIAIVGYATLSGRDLPVPELGEVLAQAGRNALLAALLGGLGVGIGALIRNQAIAIVLVLVFSMIVEPLLLELAPEVGRFAPLTALPIGIQDVAGEDFGFADAEILGSLAATAAMLAWIAALYAGAAALLQRRDVE
jgi:ABC-2 type transport system permease protein